MSARERDRILVVDDEKHVARIASHFLQAGGWSAEAVFDGDAALARVREEPRIGILFLDLKMPQKDGLAVLREVKKHNPAIEVVIVTAHGSVETAVESMKEGACDFVTKPFKRERVLAAAERAGRFRDLRQEVNRLQAEVKRRYRFDSIVGTSRPMQPVFDMIARAAESDASVLILGESGTGKDLVARTIHYNSARARAPFLAVNCAALPRELIESELFGYRKGAFTGAVRDSLGIFPSAQGGTIFLDEIVELPPPAQAKLLRALQERKVRPLGATDEVVVDARIIAATNQNLERTVAHGDFRKDLFYRVSVITIGLPSLRERRDDIPMLVEHFVEKFNKAARRKIARIEPRALDVLKRNAWEGNIRELENVVERAFAVTRGSSIDVDDLPAELVRRVLSNPQPETEVLTLREAERQQIERALQVTRGNVSGAARVLGTTRKKLYRILKDHGLD